ncbi:unnamed protein product [Vicia faba]|uniref:NB-ARC domain-containing protein n=1 Tax=Vicia faba TaxID=3906 RepID=A0AAV0ZFV5_VICFA|nr:unnamed protein product [Vicia faba]
MDRASLTDEVRNYLQQKRYVVVFDDVWSVHFWDDIEFAVLELQPLTQEEYLELFNKKAFKFECDGCCPKALTGIANEIVQKCNGLPLAIVAIEDYVVRSYRPIHHWIAEGFVKEERGKTLEEVAEGYLTELIHSCLVQVSSLRFNGKVKYCRVHDLIHDMILEKK